jgi:HEAT repeat protein
MNGAVDALIAAMNDRDGDVRAYAAASLASLADPSSASVMIAGLKDMRPQVRVFAAAGLGRIKTQNAVPALAKALNDVSPGVRSESALALGLIADTAAVNPLCAAIKDNDMQVRKNAILALGEILDPRAIPMLYTAIQESRDTLRPVIEQVLKQHTEIPFLIAALDNGKVIVRENAAYILWLMTGKDLGQDKQAWTDWYSTEGTTGKQPVKAETDKQKKEKPSGKK